MNGGLLGVNLSFRPFQNRSPAFESDFGSNVDILISSQGRIFFFLIPAIVILLFPFVHKSGGNERLFNAHLIKTQIFLKSQLI